MAKNAAFECGWIGYVKGIFEPVRSATNADKEKQREMDFGYAEQTPKHGTRARLFLLKKKQERTATVFPVCLLFTALQQHRKKTPASEKRALEYSVNF